MGLTSWPEPSNYGICVARTHGRHADFRKKQVARDLAAKAMLLAENAGTSSPGPMPQLAAGDGGSPSPGKGDQETSLVVKGWSQLCSTSLTKV